MATDDVKSALWSLKAFKALGPDGLHAGFFQKFWLIVSKSVTEEVKKVFIERRVPEYLNNTYIALIPKIQGLKTLGNYRPISLCNTGYKIVTKIIVARLRSYLDKPISPLQAPFVSSRKGVDNAIITQEVIHTLSKKRGRVGYMALKIDLEKAYDKLEWSFIRETLIRVNISSDLIDIIMSCVSTVSMLMLFNGEALDLIYPSRGIRQGDPLSPYLFILCMDFLGQLIEEKCSQNLWQPVKDSRNGPTFSHLLFADDLIFFAKADYINCSAIRDVLDDFCNLLGQTILENRFVIFLDLPPPQSLASTLDFLSSSLERLLKTTISSWIG
nr:line-1 retrotransposable element orf2 protein [Quercus suber]